MPVLNFGMRILVILDSLFWSNRTLIDQGMWRLIDQGFHPFLPALPPKHLKLVPMCRKQFQLLD